MKRIILSKGNYNGITHPKSKPQDINISAGCCWILYPRGGFLVDITLAEKIRKNFSKVRVKGAIVRVPKLNIKKIKASKIKKQDKTPVSSIVRILIKSSIESAKKERKEKSELEEDRAYRIPKEDAKTEIG